jgi:hypothetical protein
MASNLRSIFPRDIILAFGGRSASRKTTRAPSKRRKRSLVFEPLEDRRLLALLSGVTSGSALVFDGCGSAVSKSFQHTFDPGGSSTSSEVDIEDYPPEDSEANCSYAEAKVAVTSGNHVTVTHPVSDKASVRYSNRILFQGEVGRISWASAGQSSTRVKITGSFQGTVAPEGKIGGEELEEIGSPVVVYIDSYLGGFAQRDPELPHFGADVTNLEIIWTVGDSTDSIRVNSSTDADESCRVLNNWHGLPCQDKSRNILAKIGDPISVSFSAEIVLAPTSAMWWDVGFGYLEGEVAIAVAEFPSEITVVAQYDGDDAETVFGDYVSGVRLNNEFTIDIDTEEAVAAVTFTIGGSHYSTVRDPDEDNRWRTTVDMGRLAGATHDLVVRAEASGDRTIAEYEGTVKVLSQLDLDLEVRAGGTPGSFVDVENIRLIDDLLNVPLDFQVTVDWNLKSEYADRIELRFVRELGGTTIQQEVLKPGKDIVSFPNINPFRIPRVVNENNQLIRIADQQTVSSFLAPRIEYGYGEGKLLNEAETIYVTALPAWIGQPKSSVFEAGEYQIEFSFPQPLKYEPELKRELENGFLQELIQEVLKNRETVIGAGVDLVLKAKLTTDPGDARIEVLRWYAEFTVLGKELINKGQSLDKSMWQVDVHLNPKRLTASEVEIRLRKPIDLLDKVGNKTLYSLSVGQGNIPWQWKQPIIPPLVNLVLGVKGDISIDLEKLDLDLSLGFDLGNDHGLHSTASYIEEKTFVNLTTLAKGTIRAEAFGSVELLQVFDVATVQATLEAFLALYAELGVSFRGPVSSLPVPVFPRPGSHAALFAGMRTYWDVEFLAGLLKLNDGDEGQLKDEYETLHRIPLWGLPEPTLPVGFSGSEIEGSGKETDDGAQAGPAPQTGEGEGEAAEETIAVITPPGYVSPLVTQFGVDVQSLADRGAIAPGTHFLDLGLVDEATGQFMRLRRIDLSSLALETLHEELGFASEPVRITVDIEGTGSEFGSMRRLQFRLVTVGGNQDERVAARLSRLEGTARQPRLGLRSEFGSIDDGIVNFGVDSDGIDAAAVTISNLGTAPLEIYDAYIDGAGFSVAVPWASYDAIPQGGAPQSIFVRALGGSPGTAHLVVVTDDPLQPEMRIALESSSALRPWRPHQNARNPFDVNGDGLVSPMDALAAVNELNRTGPGTLPESFELGLPTVFYDASGDGILSANDVLAIVNFLNGVAAEGEAPDDAWSWSSGFVRDAVHREDSLVSPYRQQEAGPAEVPLAPMRSLDVFRSPASIPAARDTTRSRLSASLLRHDRVWGEPVLDIIDGIADDVARQWIR